MRLPGQNKDEQGGKLKVGKRPALQPVYARLRDQFLKWGKGGQYVDRKGLWVEFLHQLDGIAKEIEARTAVYGSNDLHEMRLCKAIAD